MKRVETIIFTYNRAMLLDAVLEHTFKNFKNCSNKLNIIYHWTEEHEDSYNLLKKRWSDKNIIFHERKETSIFNYGYKKLIRPLNLLWFLRWPIILKKNNDFKQILEKIISTSKEKFVTFVPDDQIFYKETSIPDKIFDLLNDRDRLFYRFFTGIHFKDEHKFLEEIRHQIYKGSKPEFLKWNLKDKKAYTSWKYNFTIEGTVYNKNVLLNLLKPMIYHNPITLEAIGLWESRFRGFFSEGFSSLERTSAGYQVNNVQKMVKTPCGYFDPDIMMKAYLKGYRLKISNKEFTNDFFNIVPKNIFFQDTNSNTLISYNEFLKKFNY